MNSKVKHGKTLGVLVVAVSMCLLFWLLLYQDQNLSYTLVKDNDRIHHEATIYLLFWNRFLEEDPFIGLGKETTAPEDLRAVNCAYTNCVFTSKRDLLPNVHDFDVVFMSTYRQSHLNLPKTRHPRQFYVFSNDESPSHMIQNLTTFKEYFNMTMTCRLDSDIPWTYGEVTDIEINKVVAPALNVEWKRPDENFTDEPLLELVKKKPKFAAWFSSNKWLTTSHRGELVNKLQKLGAQVDIYGKMGNLKLPKNSTIERKLLDENYKFYFSFENSLSVDYVTEKLFKVMNSYVVPIVYSGADLTRFAPPKSYIDANSFKTAEDLVDYLNFLSKNPEEYIKYFWWKSHYKVRKIEQANFDPVHLCNICKKFNDPKLNDKRQIYSNIFDWFHGNVERLPTIRF